jgi:hypothetical protein
MKLNNDVTTPLNQFAAAQRPNRAALLRAGAFAQPQSLAHES